MFSIVCVPSVPGEGSHLTIAHDVLDFAIQGTTLSVQDLAPGLQYKEPPPNLRALLCRKYELVHYGLGAAG